jgi:hypothetical protein
MTEKGLGAHEKGLLEASRDILEHQPLAEPGKYYIPRLQSREGSELIRKVLLAKQALPAVIRFPSGENAARAYKSPKISHLN